MSITITKGKLAFAAVLLAAGGAAQAATAFLVSHTLVSSGGTASTLFTTGTCGIGYAQSTGICVDSNATWDWSGGVLTSEGTYQAWTRVAGNPFSVVLADWVADLVINTNTSTTSASFYQCIEGNFLASVGAHGCANVGTGGNFVYEGAMAYNVGGDASCVNRTIGGDDTILGDPRGVTDRAAGGGCDATAGAFRNWIIISDTSNGGTQAGTLILANQENYTAANGNYLTFTVVPLPATVWMLLAGIGMLGMRLRRRIAA